MGAIQHTTHIVYQAIYRFKLANAFPPGKEEATYEEMAKASGLSENDVRRLVRNAMTYRIFQEPRKGVVGHTAASKFFAMNPKLQQWVGMVSLSGPQTGFKVLIFDIARLPKTCGRPRHT